MDVDVVDHRGCPLIRQPVRLAHQTADDRLGKVFGLDQVRVEGLLSNEPAPPKLRVGSDRIGNNRSRALFRDLRRRPRHFPVVLNTGALAVYPPMPAEADRRALRVGGVAAGAVRRR
jgi:hypothetical protein